MSDTKKSGRCLHAFLVGHFPSVKSDQLSEACRESRNREREAVDQFQAVETTYFPTLISSWRKSLQSTFSIQFPFFDPDSSKLPLQRNNSVPSRPISSIQMALSLSEIKKQREINNSHRSVYSVTAPQKSRFFRTNFGWRGGAFELIFGELKSKFYHLSLSLAPAENVDDLRTSPISSRQKLKLLMVHI
jgi:hypothetical protein